jgi:hypothetical protein
MRTQRAFFVALAVLVAQAVPVAVVQAKPNPTVYITRTGHKDHSFGCRYLRQSCIAVKLSKAKKMGETACSVCYPPN